MNGTMRKCQMLGVIDEEAAEKVSDFREFDFGKLQSVSKLSIAEDRSTVGCGLYGRPKSHVIPTHSPNCPTNRVLRAAIKAAPYSGRVLEIFKEYSYKL